MPALSTQPPYTRVCAALAALIPLVAALANLADGPLWHTDRALVQGLGFWPSLGGGGLSAAAVQLASWCPLGNVYQRAGAVAALGLGALGLATYRASLRWLCAVSHPEDRWLPLFALLAALLATLTPEGLGEATVPSGAALSAALCLPLLFGATAAPGAPQQNGEYAFAGILAGALAVEAPALLLLVVAVASLRAVLLLQLPSHRALGRLTGWTLLTAVPLGVPLALRAEALGASPSRLPAALDAAPALAEMTATPSASFGALTLCLAALGSLRGFAHPQQRPWLLSSALLLGTWTFAGRLGVGSLPEFTRSVELLTGAALALAATAGVLFCFHALRPRVAALAHWVTALVPATLVTAVLVNYDDATRLMGDRQHTSIETWTEEALGALPPRAALLLASPPLIWRSWAAELASGARPDLLIVPLERLAAADFSTELLEREPALSAVLRDNALYGTPSERALVQLADARPVFVELDPKWSSRLLDHLLPRGLWLEFSAFPVGHTDRKLAFAAGSGSLQRTLQHAASTVAPDPTTLDIVRAQIRQQLQLFGSVRDRRQLRSAVETLLPLDTQHPLLSQLHARLSAADANDPAAGVETVLGLASGNLEY